MKTIKILTLFLLLLSCDGKKYKYEIKGNVMTKKGPHPAIWYTDTISFDGDTAYYFNSDRSEVRILPPYTLIDHSLTK